MEEESLNDLSKAGSSRSTKEGCRRVRLGDILRANKGKLEMEKSGDHQAVGWREEVESLPIDEIKRNPYQPRLEFDEDHLRELADSIEEHGVLQPIVVRRKGDGYELVAGERRLRACRLLGWTSVPAIVRELTDTETAEIALIENLQREDLGFFEEASGYKRLIDEFGLTQEELAKRLGMSQSAIANKLRLLRLSDAVQERISREMLSERHARVLLKLESEAEQLRAVEVFVEKGFNVRQAEEWVEKLQAGTGGSKRRRRMMKGVYKDYRLLFNSVRKLVDQMNADGAQVELEERDEQEFVELRIRIPRSGKGGQ